MQLTLCVLLTATVAKRGGDNGESRTPTVGEWTDTSWSEHPFIVKLDVNIGGFSYICGGSIIATDEWKGKGVILTAAHCVEGARAVNVWVGCTSTNCRDDLSTGYGVDHWVVHPDYDPSLSTDDVRWCDNDVAVLFLGRAIAVSGALRIELESNLNVMDNGADITVFGYYGSCALNVDCIGGSDVDSLEFAATNFMPSTQCDDIYGRHVSGRHDFCILDEFRADGLQSVCNGDSGSPAVFEGKQIGLNSWGPGDCDPRYPTVLTSVPFYYEWIAEQCPECVAVDDVNGAEGECMGMESKWDRACSRKSTPESCVGVRRGTVCRWSNDHIPETAAFVVAQEGSRWRPFDDSPSGGTVGSTTPIPWPSTALIATCLVLIAITISFSMYRWTTYRHRNSRKGSSVCSLLRPQHSEQGDCSLRDLLI